MGLLDFADGNYRVGSGGLGISDQLEKPVPGEPVDPKNQWGCGNAQIFSEVSPEMHWGFSLQYEKTFMERFGMSYYGCCEPLEGKIGILSRVNNLRKISMSPWIKPERAAEKMNSQYVFSYKPNPALLAGEHWDISAAREELKTVLAATKKHHCRVEWILKDLHTLRNEPKRLWEWNDIALEMAGA